MSQQAVSVEVRLAVGAHAVLEDASGTSVSELCKQQGISRDTYYRYRRRMREEGVQGLIPRSRRPNNSPRATDADTVAAVLDKHDELVAEGWDGGAMSVHDWLTLAGVEVPSARTCHKILTDHGRTEPTPSKRPKSSYRRFEAMKPNGVWQLDGHEVKLTEGKGVVLRFQDDHSRMLMASRAASAETGEDTWKCMVAAMDRHAKPAFIQCDNSTAFTARLIKGGGYSILEARLHRIGVGMINSSPKHPQTNGKKEREWQTLEQWLRARERATDLPELQRLLDAYDLIFNTERPHQGIAGSTPARRYAATDKALPDPEQLKERQFVREVTLPPAGYFDLPGARVSLGVAWAGATLHYLIDQDHAVLFHEERILGHIQLDPDKITTPKTGRTYYRVEARP
ncbi:integrase core domain-containing protein [Janibacter cremeus]|uniref:integrase core domain-containing protein n=1 Tax=Janibacter cremeus TaxID=1285192 RepID=UPI0023F62C69|nr:integrase core domain-containing protein [Janibacter cremeus]WEV77093.1 integrase core domain-containing protein [Janibacter cremeus]WEV78156.1 integrase core domain-containing protein [Janibacter cremeus]WEV78236.1 integrase core domain-containing protein [Janibacter cremeus]WEV78316.1 integrase core domain-containing protein [Janibacter cremeus]